jgi:PhnB protein
MPDKKKTVATSISPWLTVRNSKKAIDFYKSAFNALEVYRMEGDNDDLVVKLSVDGAEFWVSNGPIEDKEPLGGKYVRMILTVSDPDKTFLQALKAGATQVFPVGEDYGWRLGRLIDPFGLHWEIGKPIV